MSFMTEKNQGYLKNSQVQFGLEMYKMDLFLNKKQWNYYQKNTGGKTKGHKS